MKERGRIVDHKKLSEESAKFLEFLESRVIGQDKACQQFLKAYNQFQAGITPANKPIVTLLFLGPTGVGKTELVRTVAEYLLGKKSALTRVDCAEYQHSHEISKLIGSPPGYLGYADYGRKNIRLAQEKIDQFQTEKNKVNVVLFDEVEKASDALHDILLGILDGGKLTLGCGDEVDFSKTIVVMTSNLGSRETSALIRDAGIGFHAEEHQQMHRQNLDQKIWETSKATVKKHFRPEFINRIDRTVVFHSLSAGSLRRILALELEAVQDRIFAAEKNVMFTLSDSARDFLVAEGTSDEYGARELKRAVERFVAQPLAALICNGEVFWGEDIFIDHKKDGKDLVFRNMGSKIVVVNSD